MNTRFFGMGAGLAFAATTTLGAATAHAQALPAGAVLNRISSAYRSIRSYKDTATLTRKIDDKDVTANVTLAVQRPNRYLLEVKGDKINTVVVSDGSTLIALRPDRKAYTKAKAPQLLMGSDILGNTEIPSPGSRLISLLLAGNLRNQDITLAKDFAGSTVTGPQGFGDKLAYVLSFRYNEDYDAKVYVTDGDYLIRRVSLVHDGKDEIVENHSDIELDKGIPAETFVRPLPEGANLVASLPALPKIEVASSGPKAKDFSAEALDGGTIHLSDFKGKVVVLDFWATWCGPCQRSMPHVEQVWREVKDKDVVVIGVCVWDDKDSYDKWMPENSSKYTFKFAFDSAGKDSSNSIASKLFGVKGIPATFVIDKEGHIAANIVGFKEGDTRIEEALKKLGVSTGLH